MKLLTSLFIATALPLAAMASAQTPDSLWVQHSVQQLQKDNRRLEQTVKRLTRQIDYLSRRVQDVEKSAADSAASMGQKVDGVRSELAGSTSSLDSRLTSIDRKVDATSATSRQKSHTALLWAVIGTIAVAIALILTCSALRKRIRKGSDALDKVAEDAEQIRERQVELDTRLTSLLQQQLALGEKIAATADATPDHSIILSVANELARIEQNLLFMDPKTRGVSQLRNRAKAITGALKNKGYEIPVLLGTEYKEGFNMDATMEEDENMEPSKMKIRRVTRPAVLYNGKLIQAAQVIVAYNPEN